MKKFVLLFLLFCAHVAFAQNLLPYKNPKLSIADRVKDLLSRMTPEEKFRQLFMVSDEFEYDSAKFKNGIFGLQVRNSSGTDLEVIRARLNSIQRYFVEQTRLGIPVIFFEEGLHGIVSDNAVVFPQSIALAATFDTSLMHSVAHAIAAQARERGIRDVFSPVINIAGDVRWGRTEETYGEDPFLTSEMAVAFVGECRKASVIATPKHFIANVGDGGRDSYPIHFDERLLNEIYFPPFKACIEKGGAQSIMTAYNSLDGSPCSENDWLLNKTLKEKWGFKGFVISDAGAVGGANVVHNTSADYPESGRQAITSGLDVIFQTSVDHAKLFLPHFLDGKINQQRIDDAVSRVLKAKFELGLFDQPYAIIIAAKQLLREPSDKVVAKQAALESIVLLRNEKKILPLAKNIRSLSVIGTDATEARLGGYSGRHSGIKNILESIRERAGANCKVSYAPGCGRETPEWTVVPSANLKNAENEQGLDGEYYANSDLAGHPELTRVDKKLDFQWTLFAPDPKFSSDFYSVRWTGKIHASENGKFKIGLDGDDGYRLYIDNKLVIDNWKKQSYHAMLADFDFERNKDYDLRVEFFEPVGNGKISLVWNVGVANDSQEKIKVAVQAARKADIAVVVVGIKEGEFQDRAMLSLPGKQEEMIRQIAATGKPVVVVLIGGSAITMNSWIDHVAGIVDAWYPGEEGGSAVAEILFGDYNPAGRLPVTFPISEAQLPLVYNHKPTGRGDDYNNLSGLPLFPFGFGLSYSTFEYSDLHFEKNSISKTDSTLVHFKIKNTGDNDGDEVVQLYVRDMLASVARPVMELKGFQRVHFASGETKELSFRITPEMLSMFNDKMETVVEPGDFRIMIGASSRDLRLKSILKVQD